MDNSRNWVLVIGILGILSCAGFFVVRTVTSITGAFDNFLGPDSVIGEQTSKLSTEIAQVLNPTPTVLPDPVTIVHEVRSLAQLVTIRYSLEKIITAEVGQGAFGWLVGDRLLFVAHGDVSAGIDLAKLDPSDLRVEDSVLYVTLPAVEIFVATIDNDESYIYERDTGLLTKGNVNLETAARQAAEEEILNSALESGILDQARVNAENFLFSFLRNLGFPEVIFVPPPTPTPVRAP
ncbi:MAG: DUF4230 domain-containing protein [Chloroflexi bacterium]|nr:DUF4230 domain-containing protein [Chloroflexota bacterium]